MKNRIILLVILFSTVWLSCEKDLSISDFEDDFGNYQPELKIEGLLQQDKPEDSIIRIIKSSTVTDTELYNGRDDDGDGNIDEYDEVLARVQDTTATVKITNLNSGEIFDFQYVAMADSFISSQEEITHTHTITHDHPDTDEHSQTITHRHRVDGNTMIPYGGYKPISDNFRIESYTQYQIQIYSEEFDKTITGVTTVYPQVEFIDTLFTFNEEQIVMNIDDDKQIFWQSDLNVTAYYVTFEEVVQINENEWETEFIDSYIASRDHDLTEKYKSASIGRTVIFGATNDIVLKLTVEALSPEYGRYVFSQLPLNDSQRSNLRDENGNPVMGSFGATAAKSIFIVIEE